MEHTVHGYLDKMPSKSLTYLLHRYLDEPRRKWNVPVILEILHILEARYEKQPHKYPPQVLEAWENYLKACEENEQVPGYAPREEEEGKILRCKP